MDKGEYAMKIRLILAGFIMCAMNTMPGYAAKYEYWTFDCENWANTNAQANLVVHSMNKHKYSIGGAAKCSNNEWGRNLSSDEYFFAEGISGDKPRAVIFECDDSYIDAGSYIYATPTGKLYKCVDDRYWQEATISDCATDFQCTKNQKVGSVNGSGKNGGHGVVIYPHGSGYRVPCRCTESNFSGSTNSGNSKCQKGDKTYASVGQEFNINCDSDLYEVSGPLSSTDNLKNNDMGSGNCKGTCTKDGWNITINDSRCAEGYKPSSDKKQCVQSTNTGNDSGGSSSSGSSSSGSSSSGGSTGGGSRRSGGGGGSSGGTIDTGAETACISTGGTWTKKTKTCTCDNAKHLIYNNKTKECVCNVGYALDTRTNECVATSQTQCETKGKDTADWIDGKCVCKEPDMIWSSNGCVVNPGKTKCDRVSGAKWTGTECKCTTDGYVVNEAGTQCVKSAALIKTEGQAASRTKIISLYKKLNGMSNDFKVSVWKDAEGNFNTARLASDSIAAVVLGTTGALVTSNIVKKNQVSSGFEDINCQIGGQTVASWGDEFSVGMQ